jgi:predicted aldo/keto reductase-like oxidoreductase
MTISRRDFLKIAGAAPVAGAVAGSAGLLGAEGAADAAADEAVVKRYNDLGKTGLKVSDLSLGGGGLGSPDAVRYALDHGITFIDTAPDYGKSEETIGKVMADSSVRTKTIIQTKFCRPGGYPGHLDPGTPKAKVLEMVDGSLKRLQTDYIDILLVHAVGERGGAKDVNRAQDPIIHECILELKKAGKIRFSGCSSHGDALISNIGWAVDKAPAGLFDTFLLSFNYLAGKGMREFVTHLKESGKGLMVMKTLRGITEDAAVTALGKYGKNLAHSAFKWVWANGADGLVVTMPGTAKQKGFLPASGGTLSAVDTERLEKFAEVISGHTCHIHCGDVCGGACPWDVAISDVLRHDMYYSDYGDERRGMEGFARLEAAGRATSACATCADTPCVKACEHELAVRDLLLGAEGRLKWA